ncbi:unnamed protein product [Closterium sp. Yama58-4]|nr:unnamed protein product [Closterium sp. Yama58-4]
MLADSPRCCFWIAECSCAHGVLCAPFSSSAWFLRTLARATPKRTSLPASSQLPSPPLERPNFQCASAICTNQVGNRILFSYSPFPAFHAATIATAASIGAAATARSTAMEEEEEEVAVPGYVRDVDELLCDYVNRTDPSLAAFKSVWRARRFSFVHDACPKDIDPRRFLQLLYGTALGETKDSLSLS